MFAALKVPVVAAYMLAAFGACKAPASATFDFKFDMLAPIFHFDRTSDELEKMKGAHEGAGRIGGLTNNERLSSLNIVSAETPQVFGDDYCHWPTSVTLRITLRPTVWVASQYAKGSCRYNVAYVHEMMHVKIARDTLSELMPGIERLLRAHVAALGALGPMPEGSLDAAKQKQLGEIQAALDGALQRADMVLDLRQARIDTPYAYEQASRACPAEGEWGRR
ncbi:MAG: hypothetical protein ACAH80_09095 [Alphaproteobacteria bacterium]